MNNHTPVPTGFRGVAGNMGIKDPEDDFFVVISEVPANVAAVFTQSRFAGPSVLLSRRACAEGRARGVITLARNANVATGRVGDENAQEIQERGAAAAGVSPTEIIIASTGVIVAWKSVV